MNKSLRFGWFYFAHFLIVVGIMLVEHWRRTQLLNVGYWPTFSWVLYRVFGAVMIYFLG